MSKGAESIQENTGWFFMMIKGTEILFRVSVVIEIVAVSKYQLSLPHFMGRLCLIRRKKRLDNSVYSFSICFS